MTATTNGHEAFDALTDEQQDHMFYALHDAREAAQERWLMESGAPLTPAVERALAEQYAVILADGSTLALTP